jgi:hypothetical protein
MIAVDFVIRAGIDQCHSLEPAHPPTADGKLNDVLLLQERSLRAVCVPFLFNIVCTCKLTPPPPPPGSFVRH